MHYVMSQTEIDHNIGDFVSAWRRLVALARSGSIMETHGHGDAWLLMGKIQIHTF